MGATVARLGAAATLAVAVAPTLLHAQAVAPSRQELNPAARSERLSAPQADLFSNPGEGPCPLAENPAALSVTSVTLNGLESVSADELRPAYSAFLNKPGGDASDLCRIRDAVADALFARGLLARVEIPAQTIDGGAVTLEVIEARIVNVSLRGDAGPAAPALEKYAAKLRGMKPFDIERVQRYILLASDVPGLKVRASVRPSSSGGRGAVDLDLNVERDEEELIVNVQNLQGKATGRWGALGRYDLNARTRYGERLTLVGYRTVFHNEQWVAQALSEARLGGDGWVVLFSHPADFTPVCTTELGRTAALKEEFAKRNVKIIAVSVDGLSSHNEWVKDIEETQHVTLNFPLIADDDRHVAELYDMIHPNQTEKFTVRTVFVIGPDKKIKLTMTYPPSTGRNFHEILRVIDSLQLTAYHSVATPVDWEWGEDVVILPAISDADADAKFPKGYEKLKPYLRITPQPNL